MCADRLLGTWLGVSCLVEIAVREECTWSRVRVNPLRRDTGKEEGAPQPITEGNGAGIIDGPLVGSPTIIILPPIGSLRPEVLMN